MELSTETLPLISTSSRTDAVQEYYFSKKLREIEQMRSAGADIINLGIGSPDLPPSAESVFTLTKGAANPKNHGYQSYQGVMELRVAFAQWYRRYFKVELNPDSEILPLIGSKEGIMHISMTFINPGDEVLVPNPGYPTYSSATKLSGGVVRNYSLTRENCWFPDIEELEKSDLSRVKIMWINYPHMPTGQRANKILFEKLISFARKHSILLCNDNPYSFILNNDYLSILSIDGAKEIALELNSLSKSHNMPGWRIGMIAGHSAYIKDIIKIKSNMDSGMFKPLQLAAVSALNSGDEWYESLNRVYEKRAIIAGRIMDQLDCRYDKRQCGLFLWGEIPEYYQNAQLLTEDLLNLAHVFITPGSIFGSNGERYIRISLCATEEILERALERISLSRSVKKVI
jgi:hypothetical protein